MVAAKIRPTDGSRAVSNDELSDQPDGPCPAKTRTDLELDRLLSAVADRTVSQAGRRLALELPFLQDREEVLRSLQEIDEARRLDDQGEPLTRESVPEVDEAVARARVGAALAAEELRAVARVLSAAVKLRKFWKVHRAEAPLLASSCDTNPAADALGFELDRAFEPDGSISDQASPRLAELRAERRASRDRIVRRLEELVTRHASILSDGYWTERDGRYVLPVRSDAGDRFVGIVHGASAGGATLFVEPRTVVSMGNRQKVLESMVTREEELVLARLSSLVAAASDDITLAAASLAHADLRAAQARLAADLRMWTPEVPETGRAARAITLVKARHPLLALDGVDVVASDLALEAGKVLVVSGPNAGGKTVALKTLGLAALSVSLGMPVAAAEGSAVALFDRVLTDVGDEQSLTKNLSTFSAHIRNLSAILDETGAGTLVLMDEIAGGTDPREGEALATAILESLAARGGAVACTTHYEALKVLALRDPRFQNASVGFDLERMTPTFRLLSGVPGASSALAVARRFGIPASLITRAGELLPEGALGVAELCAKLEAERLSLEQTRAEAARELESLRSEREDFVRERDRLLTREQGAAERESESLVGSIKRAREDLRAAQARLRSQKLVPTEVAAAAREIDRVAATVAIGGPLEPRSAARAAERPSVAATELRPGTRVFVPRLRTDAEVIELLPSGQLRVAAGPLKVLLSVDEVRRADAKAARPKSQRERASSVVFDPAADKDTPLQTSDNTVDLRGLRAHEAVAIAEQFLDRCAGSGKRVAFLIHGHGTGALRQVLREALASSPYLERLRAGQQGEGGDGVTVVWLR